MPKLVEPLRLAGTGAEVVGQLPLAGMARLGELLRSADGEAHIELRFGVDADGVACLRGRLRADLVLTCQRCCEALVWTVDQPVALGLVSSPSEAGLLPEPYEPLLVEPHPMSLMAIIEDELILALPTVARHDPEECPAREVLERLGGARDGRPGNDDEDKPNPFAVLATLKSGKGRPQ